MLIRRPCPGASAGGRTDPGVIASGDDALDFRVVGQVSHVVFNVYADALALDIEARSLEEMFKLEHFENI